MQDWGFMSGEGCQWLSLILLVYAGPEFPSSEIPSVLIKNHNYGFCHWSSLVAMPRIGCCLLWWAGIRAASASRCSRSWGVCVCLCSSCPELPLWSCEETNPMAHVTWTTSMLSPLLCSLHSIGQRSGFKVASGEGGGEIHWTCISLHFVLSMDVFSFINCMKPQLPVPCYESYSWSKGIPQGEQFMGVKVLPSGQLVRLRIQSKQ